LTVRSTSWHMETDNPRAETGGEKVSTPKRPPEVGMSTRGGDGRLRMTVLRWPVPINAFRSGWASVIVSSNVSSGEISRVPPGRNGDVPSKSETVTIVVAKRTKAVMLPAGTISRGLSNARGSFVCLSALITSPSRSEWTYRGVRYRYGPVDGHIAIPSRRTENDNRV
jgi:hypothetical protein